MNQTLVLGGPGCGKTTRLLDIMEEVLSRGIDPNQIAFVAFTRKAAHEARERAAARFKFVVDDLPYFKTLHALAFMQLGLTTSEVMGKADYATIGKVLGWTISEPDEETGALVLQDSTGDKVAFVEQMSRLTGQSVEDLCAAQGSERHWDVRLYADTLEGYKRSRYAYDFTDMLAAFLERGPFPNVRVVFVDEAQDLSPLQWKLVERIFQHADEIYIGGDDDQAIYEWSGADVPKFLSLTGNRIVLPRSHRLPSIIFGKAEQILSRIHARYPKDWTYARDGGSINYYASVDYVPPTAEGSWLYLARNRYMLADYTQFLREQGKPYTLLGRSSVDNDTVRSILCWEALRRGKSQPEKAVRSLIGHLRAGHGCEWTTKDNRSEIEITFQELQESKLVISRDEDWMTAIRMSDADLDYYRSVLRNKESLIKEPHIHVSTVHQVKGGEADHVVLGSDMSYSCYKQLQSNPDSEHRVFYVGATRAKESLHVIYPTTSKHYDI